MSANSLSGELVTADPSDSFYKPRPRTLFDPVLLDGVAQMLNYRFWLERERFFVPIGVKRISFHQGPLPAGSRVRAQQRFAEVDARRIEGDFDVRDEQGRSIFQVEGWREWWVIWPKCFLQTNHLARVAQIASPWSEAPAHATACSVNQVAFGDLEADFVARLYLTLEEWQQFQERRSVPWLLGRIAAKDAVRGWLRQHRNLLLHPLEVPITDSPSGVPMTLLPEGEPLHLSISQLDDEASAVVADHAVAIDLMEMRPQDQAVLEAQFDATEIKLLRQAQQSHWVHRSLAAKQALAKLLSLADCTPATLRVQRVCEEDGTIDIVTVDAPEQVWQVRTSLQKLRVLALASRQAVRQIASALVAEEVTCDAATLPGTQELSSQLAWRERPLAAVRMLTLEDASAQQPAHTMIAEAGVEAAVTQAGGSLLHV
jgi:phosphopantetheinyl transferase (holo-ACP synthase)